MKTEKTIKVPVFGGGFKEVKEITTDERKGQKLGWAILPTDKILFETTDHIESEDAFSMTFDFGTILKSKIKSLVWSDAGFGKTVSAVNFAR